MDAKSPINRMLDSVEWTEIDPPQDRDSDLPYMTHSGELNIGGVILQCAVLSDGQRIFYGETIERMMACLTGEDE